MKNLVLALLVVGGVVACSSAPSDSEKYSSGASGTAGSSASGEKSANTWRLTGDRMKNGIRYCTYRNGIDNMAKRWDSPGDCPVELPAD